MSDVMPCGCDTSELDVCPHQTAAAKARVLRGEDGLRPLKVRPVGSVTLLGRMIQGAQNALVRAAPQEPAGDLPIPMGGGFVRPERPIAPPKAVDPRHLPGKWEERVVDLGLTPEEEIHVREQLARSLTDPEIRIAAYFDREPVDAPHAFEECEDNLYTGFTSYSMYAVSGSMAPLSRLRSQSAPSCAPDDDGYCARCGRVRKNSVVQIIPGVTEPHRIWRNAVQVGTRYYRPAVGEKALAVAVVMDGDDRSTELDRFSVAP